MTTATGIRDRPGPLGPPQNILALGAAEFQDYKVQLRSSKLTLWLTAPANGNLFVDRVDASSGVSGRGAVLGTLQGPIAVAGSTSETPVSIDADVGGPIQLRFTFVDTSNAPQNGVAARIGERRASV